MAKKIYYVYMHNATNSKDDEVFKVKATSLKEAKEIASSRMQWQGRFTVGSAWPAQECPKDFKWWATDHTK